MPIDGVREITLIVLESIADGRALMVMVLVLVSGRSFGKFEKPDWVTKHPKRHSALIRPVNYLDSNGQTSSTRYTSTFHGSRELGARERIIRYFD